MYKFICLIAALCVAVQALDEKKINDELEFYTKEIASLKKEDINRCKQIINSKEQLAQEAKGEEGENCVRSAGEKLITDVRTNQEKETFDFLIHVEGLKQDMKNGKGEQVEKTIESKTRKDFQHVITNMQAKDEMLILAFVSEANKCRGLDH
uniref:Heteropteran venom family 6 protein 1 n=1 Tax=Ectomocoris sp. TaxID=3104572 RepID=A0AB38ZE76_9HEMI